MGNPYHRSLVGASGQSLLELSLALSLALVTLALAAGALLSLRREARTLGAAHYLAARLAEERIGAIRRRASGGFLFTRVDTRYVLQRVVDGNGNGLRSADVADGSDRLLDVPFAISHLFPGVELAVGRPVTAIEGDGPGLSEGADPVRIGSTRFLSFAPHGTGTSGTLYLAGEGRQLAVRVFGTTGRVRVFEFMPARAEWVPR